MVHVRTYHKEVGSLEVLGFVRSPSNCHIDCCAPGQPMAFDGVDKLYKLIEGPS